MKKIFINSIIIFIMASIFHFVYDIFPNTITSLFFPVNESIFEHLKLIYTATLTFSVLELILNKNKNNFFIITLSRVFLTISILLIIYLPTYYLLGENLIVTLIILFISIFLSEYLSCKLKTKKHPKNLNLLSAIILIITYIIFIYFTYNPLHYDLFLDPKTKTYGLNK